MLLKKKRKEKRFVKLNSERSDLMTEVINFRGNPAVELCKEGSAVCAYPGRLGAAFPGTA